MNSISDVSGMPRIRAAFAGWTKSITLQKRVQTVVEGLVQYTITDICFQGTIQPLSPRQIALKPEGQRAFTWLQIHCVSGVPDVLKTNDQIIYNDITFKVMAKLDYSLNGFIEYHACQDFQGSPT